MNVSKLCKSSTNLFLISIRTAKSMAGKGLAGAGMPKKERMVVEEDAAKLTSQLCGGNIYIEGEDPKLKDDSEYPEWLWKMRLDRGATPPEELDPNDSYYWKIIRRQNLQRSRLIAKQKYKFKDFD
ncbi:DgyrCDS10671 [Dimorphilus gyrociliatus]|uniref:Large ribosomal subunit protein mL54 n=1 Tax=Dimorphilus gyrociliatus TaxID=2664684 RepID=A0A7I8W0W8_9ANNE|nr:DgyrCDS10671 [Dimorphilus gyrociliatus]